MPEVDTRRIVVFAPDGVRRDILLSTDTVTVGRTPDNALVLDDPQVSRRHAEVRVEQDIVLFTDVGSTNGTFIEGQRVAANSPIQLRHGIELRIGTFVLVFQETLVVEAQAVPIAEPGDDSAPAPAGEKSTAEPFVPRFVPPPDSEARPIRKARREPLPTLPMPQPDSRVSHFLNDLPAPFQESEFLGRFLLLFETVWEPMEWRQDHIALYFDPRTCPPTFLPYLAQWIGVDLAPHWPEVRKRRLLGEAAELYRWRGTVYGLARFVELTANVVPTVTEIDDEPFTIRIVVPSPPDGGTFTEEDRDAVRRVIERHKPAHIGYYLTWA